jgi:hypothetical protein
MPPPSTYEVVTQTVTVPVNTNGQPNTYTLTAPTGKKPLAGGFHQQFASGTGDCRVASSYPAGQTWVFGIIGASFEQTVDLYLVTATV